MTVKIQGMTPILILFREEFPLFWAGFEVVGVEVGVEVGLLPPLQRLPLVHPRPAPSVSPPVASPPPLSSDDRSLVRPDP
jgi:hypothetical protein